MGYKFLAVRRQINSGTEGQKLFVLDFVGGQPVEDILKKAEALPTRIQLDSYLDAKASTAELQAATQNLQEQIDVITKDKNAYDYIHMVEDYCFDVGYSHIDYNYAKEYMRDNYFSMGACTTIRKGNLVGRNFDWSYNEEAYFTIRVDKSESTKYWSIGRTGGRFQELTNDFVKSGEYSDLYKVLPFITVDGVNECNLVVSANVVPAGDLGETTGTTPTGELTDTICGAMLVRYILDNFATATEAVNYIQEHVSVYMPNKTAELRQELHYMVMDKDKTYLLEFINNELVVSDMSTDYGGRCYMANFYMYGTSVDSSNHVNVSTVTDYGNGIERYNIISDNIDNAASVTDMTNLMAKLHFTNTYKSDVTPVWKSEYASRQYNLKVTDPIEDFASIIATAREIYSHRERDGLLWQTCHTTVYDIQTGTMYLLIQEEPNENQRRCTYIPWEADIVGKRSEAGRVITIDGVEYIIEQNAETFNDVENNIVVGANAHAEGTLTTAIGRHSHAEGYQAKTTHPYAHAEGLLTVASGNDSHAEGDSCEASGSSSHAEGSSTIASGDSGHSEGGATEASGDFSHAEGFETRATGDNSHAEGNNTTASGYQSHAEGDSTVASAGYSHAEGLRSEASALMAHAEGSDTVASGNSSHAEGIDTVASGYNSHAEGWGTVASSNYQHVQGKYNIEDTTSAEIVGNGTGLADKSNAYTLDWEGNAWFAGDVYVGSTSGRNKDTGSKKLVSETVTGTLADLDTTDKTSLVAAINEVARGGGGGLTSDIKTALLNCFANVAWTTSSGSTYYNALYSALYGEEPAEIYTISNTLTGCTTSNPAVTVEEGQSYSATISVKAGYNLDTLLISMGGIDITETAVTGDTITVASVTGNINITAEAVIGTIVPSEYQKVEYITSNGTQYINTEYIPTVTPTTLETETKFSADSGYTSDSCVLGARTASGAGNGFKLPNCFDGTYEVGGIHANIDLADIQYDTPTILKSKALSGGSQYYIDGELIRTNHTTGTSSTSNQALYLLAMNENGAKWFFHGKLYYCHIWDNSGELVRNFIPCYRKSDNIIGMYEAVTGEFYENAGTGSFGKGADEV